MVYDFVYASFRVCTCICNAVYVCVCGSPYKTTRICMKQSKAGGGGVGLRLMASPRNIFYTLSCWNTETYRFNHFIKHFHSNTCLGVSVYYSFSLTYLFHNGCNSYLHSNVCCSTFLYRKWMKYAIQIELLIIFSGNIYVYLYIRTQVHVYLSIYQNPFIHLLISLSLFIYQKKEREFIFVNWTPTRDPESRKVTSTHTHNSICNSNSLAIKRPPKIN